MALLLDVYGLLSVILGGFLLTAQSLTFGGIVFLAVVATPLADEVGTAAISRCRWLAQASAAAVILVTAVSLVSEVAVLVDALDLSFMKGLSAAFVTAGLVEIAGAAAIVILLRPGRRPPHALLALAAIVVLGAAIATSHAIAHPDDRTLLAVATALHRLCAGTWIGGIPYFLIALAACRDGAARRKVGKRFSQLAMVSVAVIVATGLTMSVFYIGSFAAFYGTAYGIMVGAKVLLLALLLLLGGMNFLTVERLRRNPDTPVLRMRRFAEVEIGIGITVLFVAASITSLPPAADLTNDRVRLTDYAERLTPHWPSFSSPDQSSLAISVLQAQLDGQAQLGQAAPTAFVPGAGIAPPRNAANIAWSEYNHHWAGIFVLAIGLLTLAERTGRGNWARNWPLLFVPLAIFLAYRDSIEAGLVNDISFLALLRDAEYVQHLFFYVLIAAFGFFEWAVRTGRLRSPRAALLFPILTAVASAGLLTHAHAIANVRDLLLIEITHVPLAILGIMVAWSRWLELRLDPAEGRLAAWVWPPCMLLVAILLLAYREV